LTETPHMLSVAVHGYMHSTFVVAAECNSF